MNEKGNMLKCKETCPKIRWDSVDLWAKDLINKYDLFSDKLIIVDRADSPGFDKLISFINYEIDDPNILDFISCDCCTQSMEEGLQNFTVYMNKATCDEGYFLVDSCWREFTSCPTKYVGTVMDGNNEPVGIGRTGSQYKDGLVLFEDQAKVQTYLDSQFAKGIQYEEMDWEPIQKYIVNPI